MKNINFIVFQFVLVLAYIFFINLITTEVLINSEPVKPLQGFEDNPNAASNFRYSMIMGNNNNIDPVLMRSKAIEYANYNLITKNNLNKTNAVTWSALGPGNIGGRIRSIIINPSNSSEIVISSVSGGIWKSTDSGSSWSAKLDTQDPLSIGSMTLVGSSTIYAGTGEAWGNTDAVYGGGIYKSTDFGNTWTILSSTVGGNLWNFKNVLQLASDPSGNVYAVTKAYNYKGGVGSYYTNGGLYKTTDGGSNWSKISSTTFSTNYFNGCDVIPISSSIILFAVNKNGATLGGIYRTTDGGTNWSKVTSGLPSSNYGRIAMTQDPNSSATIYSVFESSVTGSPDYGLKGIYKSTDSGASWSILTDPPRITSTGSKSYLSSQGWYDNVIAVDPFNSSNIYVGGVDMMKSTNGGSSWTQLTFWHAFYGSNVVHADHHAITFDPNNSGIIYNGNDGGIYKTTDSGSSWTAMNNGLEITQFYGGSVYPTGSTYYGGTQDNGHLKFSSATNWNEVYGGDGGYAAQDQTNSNIAYEEYVYLDMKKTTDGGTNWSSSISGLSDATNSNYCLFIAPFSINPDNSNILIAGSDNVWYTINSASSWNTSGGTLSAGAYVSAVTIVNTSSPYLGFAGTTDGKVFKSSDVSGGSWTNISPSGNNGAWVRRIVVDSNDKNRIFVCYSGYNNSSSAKHIWYSSDQGTNWTDISTSFSDAPVHSLVIDPNSSSTLYIGTEIGVYHTTDLGTSWSSYSSGMPTYVPVDELVLQTGTDILFAFTHGRSIWQTNSALPVELSSFTYDIINEGVRLNWVTQTETNNYGFDVERNTIFNSPDGGTYDDWTTLGFVEGHGNSNSPKYYSYIDRRIAYGKYAYRLKQIDNDGTYEFSDVIEVDAGEIPNGFILEQNYPNPFNPSTKIKYTISSKQFVSLIVYDVLGNEVATLANKILPAGNYEAEFNSENLVSGIYFYKLQVGDSKETKKMVLMR